MNQDEREFYQEQNRRNRKERLIDFGIGGVMIAILFTIAMLIVPLIPVALRPPPVEIDNIRILTTMPVCPGDLVEFRTHVIVHEPTIIGIWTGILDVDEDNMVGHTREEFIPVVRNQPTDFEELVHFRVPELAPGEYQRIAAFAAINSDTKPEFVVVPFTVKVGCPILVAREGSRR